MLGGRHACIARGEVLDMIREERAEFAVRQARLTGSKFVRGVQDGIYLLPRYRSYSTSIACVSASVAGTLPAYFTPGDHDALPRHPQLPSKAAVVVCASFDGTCTCSSDR